METYRGNKGFISMDQWGDIKKVWGDYIGNFLNTPMTCIATGRLGIDFDEQEETARDGSTKSKLVKVGTKFKAGGGESFGYEPHLLLEFSLERKAKKVKGEERPGEGRMVHRVDVLKDRTWALNGKTLRWPDRPGYKKGDYKYVWEGILPHFTEVQATYEQQKVGSDTSSGLVDNHGKSDYYERKEQKEIALEEIKNNLTCIWTAATGKDAALKLEVLNRLFGTTSWTAVEGMKLDVLQRGAQIAVAMKNAAVVNMPPDRTAVLALAEEAAKFVDEKTKTAPADGLVDESIF